MSKKINVDEIDEKSLLASIYAKKNLGKTQLLNPSPAEKDIDENIVEEPVIAMDSAKRKKNSKVGNIGDFLQSKKKEAKRPCVYIDNELHRIVSAIVKVIANQMTVGEYIDQVLWEHFKANQDEINQLYRRDRDNLINID